MKRSKSPDRQRHQANQAGQLRAPDQPRESQKPHQQRKPGQRYKSQQRKNGFALVTVLWLVALLTVIATGLAYSSRQNVRSMGALVGGVQARYLAEGVSQLVLSQLLEEKPGQRPLGDGEGIEVIIPGGSALVVVTDENGLIDINVASKRLLSRLLYSLDVEQAQADALADAIEDFRDANDLTELNGAEDDDYEAAGLPWGSKDALFTSVDELRRVYGMTPEIYQAMQPWVTIHSRQRGVNPEVAPLSVLMAVSDNDVRSLENYIEQRRENHRDGVPLPPPPLIEQGFASRKRGVTYTLLAVGRTDKGVESRLSTTVRLRRSRNKPTIETLAWQPYAEAPITPAPAHGNLPHDDI